MYSLQFSKKFPLPKIGGHFEFSPKMAKHKFASISLTVRDRVISSKFSTHRVSKECNLQFSKKFPLPNCFYLLNRARWSDFVEIFAHRVSKECNLCSFQKIFPSPKMAAILNFRIFAKNGKTRICFYLLNHAR